MAKTLDSTVITLQSGVSAAPRQTKAASAERQRDGRQATRRTPKPHYMRQPVRYLEGTRGPLTSRPFTLIEVLITITLMVTVLGVLFLGTGTVMSSWQQLGRHVHQLEELLVLDRTLDALLTNIIPFRWPDEDEKKGEVSSFVGDDSSVTFQYMHAFNRLDDGAIRTCRILVEDDQLVAYYCERPPFPESLRSDRLRRSVLAYNVDSIRFTYYDLEEDGNDLDSSDEWEEQDYIPLAIAITIEWTDGTRHTWLRRTAGTSYYERWGNWERKERT